MIAVVALAAVLATVAAVSLAGSARAARAKDVAGRVVNYDRLARDGAKRTGRVATLTFDLDRGTIGRSYAEADDAAGALAPLHLPDGFRIGRVLTAGRSATAGRVEVACSGRGQTPSYAVLIEGPRGQWQWAVVAGLTGRAVTVDDEQEVQDIFRALAGKSGASGASAGDDAR